MTESLTLISLPGGKHMLFIVYCYCSLCYYSNLQFSDYLPKVSVIVESIPSNYMILILKSPKTRIFMQYIMIDF